MNSILQLLHENENWPNKIRKEHFGIVAVGLNSKHDIGMLIANDLRSIVVAVYAIFEYLHCSAHRDMLRTEYETSLMSFEYTFCNLLILSSVFFFFFFISSWNMKFINRNLLNFYNA